MRKNNRNNGKKNVNDNDRLTKDRQTDIQSVGRLNESQLYDVTVGDGNDVDNNYGITQRERESETEREREGQTYYNGAINATRKRKKKNIPQVAITMPRHCYCYCCCCSWFCFL